MLCKARRWSRAAITDWIQKADLLPRWSLISCIENSKLMVDGVEGLLVFFVEHVLTHSRIESFELLLFDLLSAFFLKPAQFGRIFFFPAMQAGFLELQVAQLFLVREMRLELDHGRAER